MLSREVSTRVTGLTARENMDIPVRCFNHFHRKSVYLFQMWNDHINKLINRPILISGLSAAMLGFRLPVISDNIVTLFFGMLDPDNVGIGVGISLLSHL